MKNGVYQLTQACELPFGIKFNAGQEIEIVTNVVYVGGFPLQPEMQAPILNWLKNNETKLKNVTRNW